MKRNLQKAAGRERVKRAGIIVRVSSAEQGKPDKASPDTQERDCREHCEQRGYQVVAPYFDIDKYRDAHGRLVEPSGTRSDRPGLKQALSDIDEGKIDVLVGWRQDRLVRGITRALIELKERIKAGKVEIELAKEQFNLATFEVLAWAAGVELEAKHDRLMMGVAGRLAKGKTWNTLPPLGYRHSDGTFALESDEVKSVKLIWAEYADSVPVREIQRRLIARGARQKMGPKVHPWRLGYIRDILNRDCYHTGLFQWQWDGKGYQVPIPKIIDEGTAQRVKERQKKFKAYPAGNLKQPGLASGLLWCQACSYKMRTYTSHRKLKLASGKIRDLDYAYYGCLHVDENIHIAGCAQTVRTNRIDAEVWQKVWDLISKPGRLLKAIDGRIVQLQAQQSEAEADCRQLQRQIEDVVAKRQNIISWALEGKITDADMAIQLKVLDAQRDDLERHLGEQLLLADHRVDRLKELAEIYRANVLAGAKHINTEPETPEEERLQVEARRKIVERLVTRIEVKPDKSTEVHTELDLAGLRVAPMSVGPPVLPSV